MKQPGHFGRTWDTFRFDVRHSLRGLGRSPGFVVVVVLTIALVLGATITLFSLLNAIVLRTVSAKSPERLVAISATDVRANRAGYFYPDTFAAYRAAQHSFSAMSMYSGDGLVRVEARGVTADGGAEGVSSEYFDLLGARLTEGRFFTEADQSSIPVVVISDRFRRRVFGDATTVVGEAVSLDGKPVTIIGVTEPAFGGLQFDGGADLFLSLPLLQAVLGDTRPVHSTEIVGRLAPGMTIEQARAELLARWPGMLNATLPPSLSVAERQAAQSQRLELAAAASGFSTLRRQYGRSVEILFAMSVVLVAVGCINLAGLLLARSLMRRHQIVVRLALGSSRGRIFQQVLIDSLLLAFGGLIVSLPFAWWATRVLTTMVTVARPTPLLQRLTPNVTVLGVSMLIALLIGLLMAVLPTKRAIGEAMRDSLRPGRAIAGSLGQSGRLLLVAQVALSLVLLVGAGLLFNTLSRLRANGGSIYTRRIVFARLARMPGQREPVGPAYLQTLVERLRNIQGVDSAALSVYFPAFLGFSGLLPTDHYSATVPGPSSDIAALTEFVSPGFLETFGISRLGGRDFAWTDTVSTPPVVMVSDSVAHALFGTQDVVGRRLRLTAAGAVKELEIVGVVADAAIGKIRDPHQPVVYKPMLQELARAQFPMAHIRITGDLSSVRQAYTRAVESQGRHFVRGLFTLSEWVNFALLQERLSTALSLFTGGLTILLACVGVYGLLAYTVTSRTREIGVRLALGATRSSVLRMILREGLMIAVPGVLIGVPTALAATRLLRALLYGVGPNDPSIIVGASTIFIVTCVFASLMPALRASQIDPIDALRQE